jgi:hypothetical protein
MLRSWVVAVVVGCGVGLSLPSSAEAGGSRTSARAYSEQPVWVSHRRGGPKVRGFVARRGGYSYVPEDVFNTYGSSRSLYGRDYFFSPPRQSAFGPFDNGFFFDSGIEPRGGYSPYLN